MKDRENEGMSKGVFSSDHYDEEQTSTSTAKESSQSLEFIGGIIQNQPPPMKVETNDEIIKKYLLEHYDEILALLQKERITGD